MDLHLGKGRKNKDQSDFSFFGGDNLSLKFVSFFLSRKDHSCPLLKIYQQQQTTTTTTYLSNAYQHQIQNINSKLFFDCCFANE
jgi:hypothetical protein